MPVPAEPPFLLAGSMLHKGDVDNPNMRRRLVVQETKRQTTIDPQDIAAVFFATPPLEALRFLVSDVATSDGDEEKILMIDDVSRAVFEAPIGRNVCVELPEECLSQNDRENDVMGKLV